MILCIPTLSDQGLAAEVHVHFGSAPYFTLYDSDQGTAEVIKNENSHHAHGACQPLNALNGRKIDAVVTGGMGGRAVQMLNAGGIKVYQAVQGTVANVAKQFSAGALVELTVQNACKHHGGCH